MDARSRTSPQRFSLAASQEPICTPLKPSVPRGTLPAQGKRPPPSFQSENGLQGPCLCVLPTASELWTGRRRGSAVVWAKFNLSHARQLRSGLLCPEEDCRGLLTSTWALARQNCLKSQKLLITQTLKQTPADLCSATGVLL